MNTYKTDFMSLYEELSDLTESQAAALTEAASSEDIKELLGFLVEDIEALKSAHHEITKVFLSQKTENTIMVLTNITDDSGVDTIEKDIIAKVFKGKSLESIGIKYTKGTSKPIRLAYSVTDADKFAAFANGADSGDSKETNAKAFSEDQVKGLDLLAEADRKAAETLIKKISTTAVKTIITGLTFTRGSDFLALTITFPESRDDKAVNSVGTAISDWIKALGWRYNSQANPPEADKGNGVRTLKLKPIYKNFFVD